MDHRTVQLENGITLATAEMPHMESVCMGIWTPPNPGEPFAPDHTDELILCKSKADL